MFQRSASIKELMASELPPMYHQKRLMFRPSYWQVSQTYMLINDTIFNNSLRKPRIIVKPRCREYWGMCKGSVKKDHTGSYCSIDLMDKWISIQWMITTIAHEMVHQYQWDVEGPERESEGKESIMSHGPSFFKFRDLLLEHNIPLKTAHSQRRWYIYQDLLKC